MFLGGWQLWIKTFCHPANFFLAKMQLFAFLWPKLYFLARTPRNFAKRESQKLFGMFESF
jgi:NADH:ubiquinone oxidoreductase subunit H